MCRREERENFIRQYCAPHPLQQNIVLHTHFSNIVLTPTLITSGKMSNWMPTGTGKPRAVAMSPPSRCMCTHLALAADHLRVRQQLHERCTHGRVRRSGALNASQGPGDATAAAAAAAPYAAAASGSIQRLRIRRQPWSHVKRRTSVAKQTPLGSQKTHWIHPRTRAHKAPTFHRRAHSITAQHSAHLLHPQPRPAAAGGHGPRVPWLQAVVCHI
jgi:hypothetical protein